LRPISLVSQRDRKAQSPFSVFMFRNRIVLCLVWLGLSLQDAAVHLVDGWQASRCELLAHLKKTRNLQRSAKAAMLSAARTAGDSSACHARLLKATTQLGTVNRELEQSVAQHENLAMQLNETRRERQELLDLIEATEKTFQESLTACQSVHSASQTECSKYQLELNELSAIAQDIPSITTGGTLLQVSRSNILTQTGTEISGLKDAVANFNKCIAAASVGDSQQALIQRDDPSAQCWAERQVLQETWSKAFVTISGLADKACNDPAWTECKDAAAADRDTKVNRTQARLSELQDAADLDRQLASLEASMLKLKQSQTNLEASVSEMSVQCQGVDEASDYVQEVKDAIVTLSKCKNVTKPVLRVPTFIGYATFTQDSGIADDVQDQQMLDACAARYKNTQVDGKVVWEVDIRTASGDAIVDALVVDMPETNSETNSVLGSCPGCAGSSTGSASLAASGHARRCFASGAKFDSTGVKDDCMGPMERSVMCLALVQPPQATTAIPPCNCAEAGLLQVTDAVSTFPALEESTWRRRNKVRRSRRFVENEALQQ